MSGDSVTTTTILIGNPDLRREIVSLSGGFPLLAMMMM
jgi:hypothetical protein